MSVIYNYLQRKQRFFLSSIFFLISISCILFNAAVDSGNSTSFDFYNFTETYVQANQAEITDLQRSFF